MQFIEKRNNIESHLPDGPGLHFPVLHPPQCPAAPPYPDPATERTDLEKLNQVYERYLISWKALVVVPLCAVWWRLYYCIIVLCSVLLGAKLALFTTSFCCISHLVGGFITGVLQSQIHHGVLQSAAHVELQREVVHTLQMEWTDRVISQSNRDIICTSGVSRCDFLLVSDIYFGMKFWLFVSWPCWAVFTLLKSFLHYPECHLTTYWW